MAVSKEERLFLALAEQRGAIDAAGAHAALAKASAEEASLVEVLIGSNAIGLEDADAIRKELFKLSFTCPSCESVDFVEPGQPKEKGRLCEECARKKKTTTLKKTASGPAWQAAAEPAPESAPPDSAPAWQSVADAAPKIVPPEAKKTASTRVAAAEGPPSISKKTAATVRFSDPGLAADPLKTQVDPNPGPAPATAASSSSDVTEGQTLGDCRIVKKLGQGGMGRVYKGFHEGFATEMAVKVLDEKLVARQGFVDQFFLEARTLLKLDHPNVVRIFNASKDQNGRHFIVMELLEGGSVEQLWRERGRRLEVDEAVRIVRQAADGLLHAHKSGLIHRDVKPGNLMLASDGRVKVVDFGLAVPTQGELFVATAIAGTPLYMAPEQADGQKLDARCDQYALGVTLYQLLCGKAPFERPKLVDILFAHVSEPPPPPRTFRADLPEWLEAVILRTLAKSAQERYPSLAEFIAALDRKSEKATAAKPTVSISLADITKLEKGVKPRAVSLPSWRPTLVASAACVGTALLVGALAMREASAAGWAGDDVPAVVKKVSREVEALVATKRPEALGKALAQLEQEIADLGGRAGAARLDELRKVVQKQVEDARASEEKTLEERVASLLERKRYAAAFEVADPQTATLAALGLGPTASKLREQVTAALAARGELYVPAGPFRAGPAGSAAATGGFYVDRTEVTNEAWSALVESAGLARPAGWPASGMPAALAKKPVTGVSFEDAERFARALGKRLPTSAEWEKAARGTDARSWPWGDRFEPGRANVLDGGALALEEVDARAQDASPWGVLGMAGNAFEWVVGESGPLVAGGAFASHALSARVFARFAPPTEHDPAIGFRCVRDLERD